MDLHYLSSSTYLTKDWYILLAKPRLSRYTRIIYVTCCCLMMSDLFHFSKSFFHAFDDYIKNIDILKIHHLKKNFYSIVQLQPIRNIFSLRSIIKSRNFFRFIFFRFIKIVKVTISFWKICRSRYFRQRSVLLLDSFSWGIGEGQNCQVERDRMGMSRFRMRPRVWADSSDANARNWWTPWYVCASTIMSLASENRSENISRDKLLSPSPLLYLLQSKLLRFLTLWVYDVTHRLDR